jgi:nucleotide-binding universal stress UspA family protein
MILQCPIPKILLPVDGSDDAKRAVQFAGCLGSFIGKSLSGITLLRVLTGGYISRHLANVDLRAAEILKSSEIFKRVRAEHIRQNIIPLLDETEKVLKETGVDTTIEKLVTDGDAANEIIRIASERGFSTIMMARRGLSAGRGAFLGNVTSKVIHAAHRHTVYIVGHRPLEGKACPFPKMLIPVDGSLYSMKGLGHAVCLASNLKGSLGSITLLRVINIALYMERLKKGIDPEEEAQKILDEGKKMFREAGIAENLVTVKIKMGSPTEEIIKDIEAEDYNFVVMGRKGRTALKEMFLGGVSSTVLQRCANPTIALVSSDL